MRGVFLVTTLALTACWADKIQPDRSVASTLPTASASASSTPAPAPKAPAALRPPFEKIADATSHALEAMDADALYVASMFGAARIEKATGKTVDLTKQQLPNGEQHLAIDATHVYWVEGIMAPVQLFSVEKTGGTPKLLSKLTFVPEGIAVDDTRVYLTHRYSGGVLGSIWGVSKKGGPVTSLVPKRSAGSLFVDAGFVYWAHYEAAEIVFGGNIERWPSKGGPVTALTPLEMPAPFGMVGSGSLFLSKMCLDEKSTSNPGCTVHSVPATGGKPHELYTGSWSPCYAASRDVVFVVDQGEVRVFEPGKPVFVLAKDAPSCEKLLIDDKALYWSSDLGVVRLPR